MSYEQFYKTNFNRAVYLCRNILRNEDDAYDLASDLFLTIQLKYDSINNPVHYLNRALSRAILNYKKNSSKQKKNTVEVPEEIPDPSKSYLELELKDEERERKKKADIAIRALNEVLMESDETTNLIFRAKILGKIDDKALMLEIGIKKAEFDKIIKSTQLKVRNLLISYGERR